MRILHTSDWHLGKKLYKKERTSEHEKFLHWLSETIKSQNIEVLIIAGDIFDTPVPTTESLSQFFRFLKDLENYQNAPLKKVLILAGNHDSAKLLESPRPFLNHDFIKVVGNLTPPKSLESADIEEWKNQFKVSLKHKDHLFNFCLLPFFRTREILAMPWVDNIKESNPEITQEDMILDSLNLWSQQLISPQDQNQKCDNILISHHVFGSFMASGSEQGVALSGIDSLPLSLFKDYSLLLLGHIHKKQVLKKQPLALYCGSPIPLRFSESNNKSVFILENTPEKENWSFVEHAIPIFRPLIRVESNYEQYKEDIKRSLNQFDLQESPLQAYLELTLKMESPTSGLLEEIRDFLKDLPVELINYFTSIEKLEEKGPTLNINAISNKSTSELFDLYLNTFQLDQDKKQNLSKCFMKLCSLQNENKNGGDS